jgi:hypothetical protein
MQRRLTVEHPHLAGEQSLQQQGRAFVATSAPKISSLNRDDLPKMRQETCQEKRNISTFKNILLAVMWNWEMHQDVADELSQVYEPWFASVVHIGGNDTCNFDASSGGISYDSMGKKSDTEGMYGGVYMYACYAEAAKIAENNKDIQGVLFVADDAVWRPWDLQSLGLSDLSKVWSPLAEHPQKYQTFLLWDDDHQDPWVPWVWGPTAFGYSALNAVFSEYPDWQDELNRNLGCATNCLPDHHMVDILYLPIEYASRFQELAVGFKKHGVYAEAAIPVMVAIFGPTEDVVQLGNTNRSEFKGSGILATDIQGRWSWYHRGLDAQTDKTMNVMAVNPDIAVTLHPAKMGSNPEARRIWRRWFSGAGPCLEIIAIEHVLASKALAPDSVEHLLSNVMEAVEPPALSPFSFRPPLDQQLLELFETERQSSIHTLQDPLPKKCKGAKLWAVLTRVNSVVGLKRLDDLPDGWCVLVVADTKTLTSVRLYINDSRRIFYLSPDEQSRLPFEAMKHLPSNSFSRKNIGYIVAAALGAETIYDTDDDTVLLGSANPPLLHRKGGLLNVRLLSNATKDPMDSSVNIYSHFDPSMKNVWPRGTPLRTAMKTSVNEPALKEYESERIAIEQSLVAEDPDVDSIYRMGPGMPKDGITFDSASSPLVLDGVSAPTNSKATSFSKEAFPLLLLPASLHPRVADVWRGYLALPVLRSRNLSVAYVAPKVKQVQRTRDEKEDLWAEWPLYHKADALALDAMSDGYDSPTTKAKAADSIANAIVEVYANMYQKGLLEESDVKLCKAFVRDITGNSIDASYQ